jgi:hypothetical protein
MAELLKGAMMAINGIQFQKGLSLAAFLRDYGTEEQCEAAFIKARWPRGFICSRCGHTAAHEFKRQSHAAAGDNDSCEALIDAGAVQSHPHVHRSCRLQPMLPDPSSHSG